MTISCYAGISLIHSNVMQGPMSRGTGTDSGSINDMHDLYRVFGFIKFNSDLTPVVGKRGSDQGKRGENFANELLVNEISVGVFAF